VAKSKGLLEAPYRRVVSYVDANGVHGNTPFYQHDELMSYVFNDQLADWRPNEPFEAELELVRSERGRSSVVFVYRDTATNIHYPLFVSSVEAMLRSCVISNGRVRAVWKVAKRGSNYGLDLYGPAESAV
jgi:hypothetical protein